MTHGPLGRGELHAHLAAREVVQVRTQVPHAVIAEPQRAAALHLLEGQLRVGGVDLAAAGLGLHLLDLILTPIIERAPRDHVRRKRLAQLQQIALIELVLLGRLTGNQPNMRHMNLTRRQRVERVSELMIRQRLGQTGLAASLRSVHAGVLTQLPRSRPRPVTTHQLTHRSQKPRLGTRPLSRQLHDTTHQIAMSQRLQAHRRHTNGIDERATLRARRSSLLAARRPIQLSPVRDLVPSHCRRARRLSRIQIDCVIDLGDEPAGGSIARHPSIVSVNDRRMTAGPVLGATIGEHERSIHTYAPKCKHLYASI